MATYEKSGLSVQSQANTTFTPLTAASSFTGTGEYCDLPDVMVACVADVAGTLYIEFSIDGDETYDVSLPFPVTAGTNEFHSALKGPRFCRIRFVNGATNQSYLRLHTSFGHFAQENHSLNSTLGANADATAVRPSDYMTEVALGRRAGANVWSKFGYNTNVSDAGPELVGSFGGAFTPLLTATTLSIVSTDAADDDGSTGANSIVVEGVDANREAQTEVVTMNGTTPVVTTSTWLGINRMSINLAGTGLSNAGTITATAVTGSTIQGQMPAGNGVSQQCIFFTHVGAQALISHILVNVQKFTNGQNPIATFKLWTYDSVTNAKHEVVRMSMDSDIDHTTLMTFPAPLIIERASCSWFEVTTTENATQVTARMGFLEVDDQ